MPIQRTYHLTDSFLNNDAVTTTQLIEQACQKTKVTLTRTSDSAYCIKGRDKRTALITTSPGSLTFDVDDPRDLALVNTVVDMMDKSHYHPIDDCGYTRAYGKPDHSYFRYEILGILDSSERILYASDAIKGRQHGRLVGTNKRVILSTVAGFTQIIETQYIPLEKISSIETNRATIGMMLITLHTSNTEIKAVTKVKNAMIFQETMREPIDNARFHAQQLVAAPGNGPKVQSLDVAGQLVKLAELHAGGALSDEEFAAAKARVLAGA
nr:MAG TPA: Bacterial PH domain protein [Caudoviricetes sp.]